MGNPFIFPDPTPEELEAHAEVQLAGYYGVTVARLRLAKAKYPELFKSNPPNFYAKLFGRSQGWGKSTLARELFILQYEKFEEDESSE